MKTREQKQKDLDALTEQLQNSKSAMVVGFSKLTVTKDQEFRSRLRDAGAQYRVVKNTLARRAAEGTAFEQATEHFKGVTALAWTEADAVVLSKTVSKFLKDNADVYSFKVGVVDGKVVTLKQVEAIASLPSKEELISKLLFVINAQAQRIVTVINAVPRNLAVVIKQIGEGKSAETVPEQKSEPAVTESEPQEEAKAEEAPGAEEGGVQKTAQTVETEESQAVTSEAEQSTEQQPSPEAAVPTADAEPEKSE